MSVRGDKSSFPKPDRPCTHPERAGPAKPEGVRLTPIEQNRSEGVFVYSFFLIFHCLFCCTFFFSTAVDCLVVGNSVRGDEKVFFPQT